MKTLLLALVLTLPASAQRKLWTWTPPRTPEQTGFKLVASATAPNGMTGILYALIGNDEQGVFGLIEARAALISSKGFELANEYGTYSISYPYHSQLQDIPSRWKTISASNSLIAMSDGDHLIRFSSKGGITVTRMVESDELSLASFPDVQQLPVILKHKRGDEVGVMNWTFYGTPGLVVNTKIYSGGPLELWSLK